MTSYPFIWGFVLSQYQDPYEPTRIQWNLVKLARDLTRPGPPNDGLVREMGPLISGKSRLVKYYFIWPDGMKPLVFLCQVDEPRKLFVSKSWAKTAQPRSKGTSKTGGGVMGVEG